MTRDDIKSAVIDVLEDIMTYAELDSELLELLHGLTEMSEDMAKRKVEA